MERSIPSKTTIAACAALAFVAPSGASALPGQSLAAFHTWVAGHAVLRGIERTKDEMSGRPQFRLQTADRGIAWTYDAATDARGTIRSERLAVSGAGGAAGSAPISHGGSGYGYVFFRSLYGDAIARDYSTSKRIASFSDPTDHTVTSFYRGARYG